MLTVLFFARLREIVGTERLLLAPPADVAQLRTALLAAHPNLAGLLPQCVITVNAELVSDAQVLQPGDEVAVLPPVSGG
jgi:molybdopterin converting factor subunit 1